MELEHCLFKDAEHAKHAKKSLNSSKKLGITWDWMIPDIIESEKDSNVLCSGNFRIIAQVFAFGKTVTVCKKFI